MNDTNIAAPAQPAADPRRPYTAPRLVVHGDVAQLTQGPKTGALPDADNVGSHTVPLM
jgi:hypothetical protein